MAGKTKQAPREPTRRTRIPPIASDRQIDLMVKAVDQLARVTRPRFYGGERVTGEPAMFVGNHTLYGVFDVPYLVAELWKTHGIAIRSLGDHRHWFFPGWREFLEAFGAVRGTPENASALMRHGASVLVYPGGAREVNKRRGEKYRLIWKNRVGFAKLAIEHNYPIVPFASIGAEEMFDIVIDDKNPLYGALSGAVRRVAGVPLPTLARGIGPTLLPRPQRLYFWFGDPIDSAPYKGKGPAGARKMRDEVKRSVEQGIEFLLDERAATR